MNAPLRTTAPASQSQPLAQIIALGELDASTAAGHSPALQSGSNPLHAVRANLQVCVGEIGISVGELLAAKEGQVLVLDTHVEQPIELRIGNSVVARGQLVAVGEHFAVRITGLPVPLHP